MGEVKENKRCLLITGTIVPNSIFVTHDNVEARLREYYEALLFYALNFPNDSIFFLENSKYDFSTNKEFQKLFSEKKITVIKFPVSDKFNQGKGYQEFEMLDGAIAKLQEKYDCFIKITGRYKVINLQQITNFPCKGLVIDCHKKTKVAQTNVFYVTTAFYNNYLKGLYLKADDSKGVFIEKIVYEKIKAENFENPVSLFPSNPVIIGTSGSYGGTLHRNKFKMILRNFERKLLRTFGIKQFLIEY